MAMSFKCSGCGGTASYGSRHEAIAAGWTFVDIATAARIKYVLLCAKCGTVDWLKKALKD